MKNLLTFLPLLGVILAPLLTYAVAKRQRSGRVDTTEAATLWAEAEKMREVYREEAARLRDEVITLRAEVVALRAETLALRREGQAWREEASQLRDESATLRQRLKEVEGGA